jgi:hypothetical protein
VSGPVNGTHEGYQRTSSALPPGRLRAVLAEQPVGWLGAAALLTAFGLSATGIIRATSATYLLLNLGGAVGLAYASLSRRAYPPAVLNIIWAFVAAMSLLILAIRI